MKYNIPLPNERAILNDSNVKETLNIIESLTGKKINLKIESNSQLLTLLNEPETLLDDKELIADIKNLKELIVQMSDIYNG